ncbi:MAG: exopolyphosphatase [Bacteroidetes bacterium]|nr:exopolyphosphatase [Bacteroidota bacterium]
MEIRKFAAIDIGSNSVRLLVSNVLLNGEGPLFKKSSLIRVPVRLGGNSFTNHQIPEVSILRLEDTMMAFKYLMKANEVVHYKGCATSAMRESANGPDIVRRIKEKAGISIEIISGNIEANLIFSSQNAALGKMQNNCLFVDVGGGSTEITIFSKGKAVAAQSFPIGTLRMLQLQVEKEDWRKMKEWVKEKVGILKDFSMIGSGGNINKISKLAELKPGKSLSFDKLDELVEDLRVHTYDERMKIYDLNPDRADVIIPAGEIFLTIMKWVAADKIFVPKIGLGDGIVREVYKEYLDGKKSAF